MNRTSARLKELFDLHFSRQAKELDQQELWDYIDDPVYAKEIDELISKAFLDQTDEDSLSQPQIDGVLQQIFKSRQQPAVVTKVRRLWPRIAAAAAIIIVVGAGIFYFNQKPAAVEQNQVAKNDIAPGHQGATLTLSGGRKIKLTSALNGELAKEAGVSISKSADGKLVYEIIGNDNDPNKINVLSTARGETYQVRLPDGSMVALNAASSLEYPANFTALKQRRVKLTGEGYFEIAKDRAHPFIVQTDKQEVEVLGTHFNINSYADEPMVKTTLLEGSVKVSQPITHNFYLLKPGEQASLTQSGKIAVEQVNANKAVAWKNGKFVFDNEDIGSIMRKLARWYNVEVVYEGDVSDRTFGGSISRYDNISKILDKITLTRAVHFKIEGRRITVMR